MCVPAHEIASGKGVQGLDDLLPLLCFNSVPCPMAGPVFLLVAVSLIKYIINNRNLKNTPLLFKKQVLTSRKEDK